MCIKLLVSLPTYITDFSFLGCKREMKHKDISDIKQHWFIQKIHNRKHHYLITSTTHGVAKIKSDYKAETFFWLCIVFIGASLSLLSTSTLISKYYSYEIYTSVTRGLSDKHFFPSVTFCDYQLMLKNYYTYCGRSGANLEPLDPDMPCPLIEWNLQEVKNVLNSTKEWSNGLFHVVTCNSYHHSYGIQKECGSDVYLKSISKHNNTCFTWNPDGNFYDELGHVDIGLVMNKSAGSDFSKLFAIVHDPNVTELQLMYMTFIEPAKIYQLKLQTVEINRLKHPFSSNCTDAKTHDIFAGRYTRTKCIESMNYVGMLEHCGDTFDYMKRHMPRDLIRKYTKNVTINEAMHCMAEFSNRIINSTHLCPVPCHEIEVHTMPFFYKPRSPNHSLYNIEIIHNKYDSYKVINERPLYTWEQVAGEAGGIIGLIVGVSFISIVELFVYFTLFIIEKFSIWWFLYLAQ